ncbi:MAG: hypothetical protein ACRDRO_12750, partial [Pseudonocardiaceae bacterium]
MAGHSEAMTENIAESRSRPCRSRWRTACSCLARTGDPVGCAPHGPPIAQADLGERCQLAGLGPFEMRGEEARYLPAAGDSGEAV